MAVKDTIFEVFREVFLRESGSESVPALDDDTVLLETGLDSLGFAILVVELEDRLGFDPFSLANEPFYPTTLGEFVGFYETNQPR